MDEEESRKQQMEFELPDVGVRAYEDLQEMLKEKEGEDGGPDDEDFSTPSRPVESVDAMSAILNKQAAKIHGDEVKRPPTPNDGKKKEDKKNNTAGKMIIGLSGTYAGQPPPRKTGKKEKRRPSEFDEFLDFLEESIDQYQNYIENIGRNGLAAANLGYYRDDVQEMLDFLKYEKSVNLKPYWERIVKLDLQLRAKARLYVQEVGHNNFKQYQIINDPPLTHWWWYLNRQVSEPVIQPKFWEVWKKI